MNLDPLQVLRSASLGMFDGGMLGLREGYEQASAIVLGIALGIVADQLENAVVDLTEENASMREIFQEALAVVELGAAAPRARLEAAVGEADTSLRVSALRETNDRLRALLGDLLSSIEEVEAAAAVSVRVLEEHIWDELNRSTQRRAVALAPF